MAILRETSESYLLEIPYRWRVRARRIPGYSWNSDLKVWYYPKTEASYQSLRAEFGDQLQDKTVRQDPIKTSEASRWSKRFPNGVVTAGSGPYEENHFDSFLEAHGISFHPLGTPGIEVMVLGRDDWEEKDVDAHVDSRRGVELRLYSQEMFLAYLATEQDPHDDYEDSDILEAFGEGHPGFEFLESWGFDWPQTTIVPGRGLPGTDNGDPANWPQVGLLKHLGYTVGGNGVSRWERQKILRAVFMESVPNVQSQAYMNEWGMPKSSMRLQKLANSIAAFARNAQRRESPPQEAIQDWEEDLSWLQETFYRGRFRFYWPST